MKEEDVGYPEVGELVIATASRVVSYGAYVRLDEYRGREGLIHISELSTRWVKNIHDFIREGQKLVLKVLRVNPERNQVDLSLRNVSGRERAETMLLWKKDKRAEGILKHIAEGLKSDESSMRAIEEKISGKYGSVYDTLEKSISEGEEMFLKADVPPEWATALVEAARSKIKIKRARKRATIQLTINRPKGIEALKAALVKAKEIATRDSNIKIYTVGAPRYCIEVEALDYSDAETILEEAVNEALTTIKQMGGEGQQVS